MLRAYSAEMRYSIHSGRQTLGYTYSFSEDYQAVAQAFRSNPYGEWYVPLWHQSSKAGAVGSTDTALTVDLNADYTDKAVIFGSCTDYVIVDIDSVTTTLNLTAMVGAVFTNPTVAPIRQCVPIAGAETRRNTRRHTQFDISFLSREGFSPSGSTYLTLGGLPFLPCSAPVARPVSGSIVYPTGIFDDGRGDPVLIPERGVVDQIYSVAISQTDKAEIHALRKFLGDIRGSDAPFWVVDWEGKLALTASLSIGATTANFAAVLDDVADYVGRAVKIGDELRTVSASADIGGGVHQITFAELTAAATQARLLRKVRMAQDRFTVSHLRGFASSLNFSVIEVAS